MKRQSTLIITFSILVAIPLSTRAGIKRSPATGVQQGQIEFSPTIGASLPIGDLADGAGPGFVVGGRVGVNVSKNVSIGGSLNYNSFGVDSDLQNLFQPGVDVDITSLEYMLDVRALYSGQPKGAPYIKGMVGAANFKLGASLGGASASASTTELAFGGGGGYLFKGEGNLGGFFEILAVTIATEGSASTYITLRGGLSFFFGGATR